MQQTLKIRGFLLVTDPQFAIVVHPGMRPFHHPASRFAPGPTTRCFGGRAGGDMGNITPSPHFFFGGLAHIASVHTKILRSSSGGFGPFNNNGVKRPSQQLHVVPIGPGDDKRERGATTVHQQTALGSFFSPDLSGCFPQRLGPGALCLASRPDSAIPRQCLPVRHTPPNPRATSAQRIPRSASAESIDGSRWRCQNSPAVLSTDNPCAAHRQWPQRCSAAKWLCARRPLDADIYAAVPCADCAAAATVRRVTKARQRLPKTGLLPCGNSIQRRFHGQMLFTDKL